ncbi:hypothetical protein [Streptomyces aureocirculatus]|uniref:hypothetical protein n=1 Tax=Streptomyces aureocirculatus TaxID=67275 RepID=UPI0006912E89|nr:hypothetical protein [Streptomyces aureocirculatus]
MSDRHLITEWLARAHPVPRQADAEWANHGVALLPLGVRFDALRVPAPRIHAAIGSDDRGTVGKALEGWLHGPVVRDVRTGSGLYYVLIAPDAPWEGPAERLGQGIYLGVPRIDNEVSPVTYWAVQPERPGHLCDPAHLAALLSTAEPLEAIES